jgi:hypothetical protein
LVSRIEVEVEGRGDFLAFGAGTLVSPDHLVSVPGFISIPLEDGRESEILPVSVPAPGTEIPIGPSTVRRVAGGVQAGDESKRLHAMISFRTSANDLLLMSGHSHSRRALRLQREDRRTLSDRNA